MADEDQTPKLHIDSDWKAEAQKEKERLVAEETARAEKSAAPPGGQAGGQADGPPGLPEASFTALSTMLAQQAMMGLGTQDPQTKSVFVDLEGSRFAIDILVMTLSVAQTGSLLDRHYLLIRRVHSFSGLFPIGAFLLMHLTTNSSIVWGRMFGAGKYGDAGVETFQHEVDFIHNLPALALMEWGVLFLPIILHGVLGMWFGHTGKSNVARYSYQGNWRYTIQRITGYLGVVFIFMHITSLRYGWEYAGLMPKFAAAAAASSTAIHFQQGAWGLFVAVFYLVSVLGLVFHLANGLWTAGITWGLTVSESAQRRWGWVCLAIGIMLGAAAVTAIVGFSTLDIEQAQETESLMSRGDH